MKKLAVLLPTYNAAAYLNKSIDSILSQTFVNFDLYIYDDFSTDNSEEIIAQYNDSRLYYRKNTANFGIAKTLNIGLDELLPCYEYVARMDADDWSYPERFEKQLLFLDKNQETIMCGTQGFWLKHMDLNLDTGWEYPTEHNYIKCFLLFAATFGHSSVIFRSESMLKHKLRYNETIETCEDWDLWIRVIKKGIVANLPDFLMKYQILDDSNHRSTEKIKKHFEERSKIIANYWANFNVILSPEQVYEYYYSNKVLSKSDFLKKLNILIVIFNNFYSDNVQGLSIADRKNLSSILSSKILDFWKRSKVNKFDLMTWFLIVKEVKFINKLKFLK